MRLVYPLQLSEDLAITPIDKAICTLDPANYQSLFVLILANLLDQGGLQLDQAFWVAYVIPVLDFVTIQEHLEEGVILCLFRLLPQPRISAMFDRIEPLFNLGHFPFIQRIVLLICNQLVFWRQLLMLLFSSYLRDWLY